jgi:protein O-mannosyl-transferase
MTAEPGDRRPGLLVAAVAVVAAVGTLANGFVYDDIPIILENPVLHQLASAGTIWRSGYWPAGLLYRPITSQLFAVEWAIGGGRPWLFHAVNLLLAVATALAFWRLAVRLLPTLPALLAALLFAAHPVHVESVANVVGQAELLASLFTLVAVERYIAWSAEGALSPPRRWCLAALTLLAILSKETGYVVPLLLAAAELTVARTANRRAVPARELAPAFLLQMGVVVGAILVRIAVLGPTPAAGPAVALRSLAPADRIVGMLAVVPEWLRLLFWPAHLQAEYGPPALAVTGTWGVPHTLGLALLLAAAAAVSVTWRKVPVLAFGLAWTAIALLPVSNLLTATGVILAERTLLLPSAGAMLVAGGALAVLLGMLEARGRRVARGALVAAGMALVAAGAIRSCLRAPAWRTPEEFFPRLEADAPRTYRAHLVASVFYSTSGRYGEAERAARQGLALYQGDPQLYEQLGQVLRVERRCVEAIPILREGVRRFPDRTVARSRLIECKLAVADTAGARAVAEEAVRLGYTEFASAVWRLDPTRPAAQSTVGPKVPQ